jgi:hypothetical protein
MLATGEIYNDLGGDYYAHRDPERKPSASLRSSSAWATPSPSTTPKPRRTRQPQADLSAATTGLSL